MTQRAGSRRFHLFGDAAESGLQRTRSVRCAACTRTFESWHPRPGCRVRCTECGTTVTVGAPVRERRKVAWSRTNPGALTEPAQGSGSDATNRCAASFVLVAIALACVTWACQPTERPPLTIDDAPGGRGWSVGQRARERYLWDTEDPGAASPLPATK